MRRARNCRNHTGTHLMHAALRNILGTHVKQAGSLVAPDHLRFDFSHYAAVDPSEIAEIEQQVNEEIVRNAEIQTDLMNIDAALASGALAFFGDKYPEHNVRVVTIPDAEYARGFYSKELCGGTHVTRSGEIGIFKIVAEQSSAAGVRRIDAITGDGALAEYQKSLATLRKIAALLNAGEDEVLAAVERQAQTVRQLEKQLTDAKRKSAVSGVDSLLESAREIKGVKVLAGHRRGRGSRSPPPTGRYPTPKNGLRGSHPRYRRRRQSRSNCRSYEGSHRQSPRRQTNPGISPPSRRFRRRPPRLGRGWRKRHICPRNYYIRRLHPRRTNAIIKS